MIRRFPWIPAAVLVASAVLFFFINRAAYKGYFSDDDLTNLGWPTFVGNDVFVNGLITPKFDPSNFRPAAFLYYRYMGRTFKLHYTPYVAVLQALHILNAILLFFILRRLDLPSIAAWTGALFYVFSAVAMEAYWKPMYVFDLMCATFCLATMLLYIRGRWILAVPMMWLAYKSKEMAVMLPVALLAHDFLFGRLKLWWRLIPFFVISLLFGLQALWHNTHMTVKDVYALNFSPRLLWNTIAFYSSSALFIPFGVIAILLLPLLLRDRRLILGLVTMLALLFPLIALSNRVANAYWYVPLIGLSIAAATIAAHVPRWAIPAFFAIWLPVNYGMVRTTRNDYLARSDEARSYVNGLRNFARGLPPVKTVVFDATPPHMEPWGIDGAIKLIFGFGVDDVWVKDDRAQQALRNVPAVVVSYYPVARAVKGLVLITKELPRTIDFSGAVLESQLGPGWYADYQAAPIRRTMPKAELTLYRPAGATEFSLSGVIPAQSSQPEVPSGLTVLEDGQSLGTQTLTGAKEQILHWKLSNTDAGERHITILSTPVRYQPRDVNEYGIVVSRLGYSAR